MESVEISYLVRAQNESEAMSLAEKVAYGQTLGYKDTRSEYSQFVGEICSISRCSDSEDFRGGAFRIVVRFPAASLFGNDLSGLLTVAFGKISFAPGFYLEKISGSPSWQRRFAGPRVGWDGILKRVGRLNGPLLMAILKPGIGPSTHELAKQCGELMDAGVDLVKDDEVCIDPNLNSALTRLKLVLSETSGKGIYLTHLNGLAFEIRDRALRLQDAGAQGFLFCPYTYGLSVLQSLCSDPAITVPIFVHPAWIGSTSSGDCEGTSPVVLLGALARLAGADGVLYPSPYGSIALAKKVALAIHHELLGESGGFKKSASIPSAGITTEMVPQILSDFGREVVINAGTGLSKTDQSISKTAASFLAAMER